MEAEVRTQMLVDTGRVLYDVDQAGSVDRAWRDGYQFMPRAQFRRLVKVLLSGE